MTQHRARFIGAEALADAGECRLFAGDGGFQERVSAGIGGEHGIKLGAKVRCQCGVRKELSSTRGVEVQRFLKKIAEVRAVASQRIHDRDYIAASSVDRLADRRFKMDARTLGADSGEGER